MSISQEIFKAYDVRGIYPDTINEQTAEKIGYGFALFSNCRKVIVGRDMRLSSPKISSSLIKGICRAGVDVVDIGEVGTDVVYFASGRLGCPGVMITASHNPAEWNGMKFCLAGAAPVSEDTGLKEIKKLAEKDGGAMAAVEGKTKQLNILPDYVEHVLHFIDKSKIRPLKIAVDAGNGMAGKLVPAVFAGLPCKIVPLYFALDGSFPHHQPSPIEPENVQDLVALVKKERCDFGMAFDGDADRVFFIDDQGGRVISSYPVAMIAEQILKKSPGEKIIYNVACSKIVPETIKQHGGIPLIERVGHSFIKDRMKREQAIFAGEHSGHYYFKENFRADSGIIAALLMTEFVSERQQPLSELLQKYHKYFIIEETNSEVRDKEGKMKELEETYKSRAKNILQLDGLTMVFDDYWFNVRPSNTEPLLRLNLEADSKELLATKTKELLDLIRS